VKVLVVEDEARVADFIQQGLRADGWHVTVAPDGRTALYLIESDSFDVVVLDLMLPDLAGQEVCRRMRARRDRTPILMLTALDKVDERVAGLRLGADDYLTKPFDFSEFAARLEALARRKRDFEDFGPNGPTGTVLRVGPISFDSESLRVHCHEKEIPLTMKERETLTLFLDSPGKVISRERVLNAVWGVSKDPLTNAVDVTVARLRKKLGPCGAMIETVRGAGYRLKKVEEGENELA